MAVVFPDPLGPYDPHGASFDPYFEGFALTRRADGTYGGFMGIGNYNPSRYILTTKDGTQYLYDQVDGLEKITDLNSRTVTVTDTAITHSNGTAIQLVRDPQGRPALAAADRRQGIRRVVGGAKGRPAGPLEAGG